MRRNHAISNGKSLDRHNMLRGRGISDSSTKIDKRSSDSSSKLIVGSSYSISKQSDTNYDIVCVPSYMINTRSPCEQYCSSDMNDSSSKTSAGVKIQLIHKLRSYKEKNIPYILVYEAIEQFISNKLSEATGANRRDLQLILTRFNQLETSNPYDKVIELLSDSSYNQDWVSISDIFSSF